MHMRVLPVARRLRADASLLCDGKEPLQSVIFYVTIHITQLENQQCCHHLSQLPAMATLLAA